MTERYADADTCISVTEAAATTSHFAALMKTCSIVYKA